MNYITKTCETCNKPFKVSEEWSHNRLCLVCFNLRKEGIPIVKDNFNAIAAMAVWKGLCNLRQGKGTPIKKMIEDAKMVYDELFKTR